MLISRTPYTRTVALVPLHPDMPGDLPTVPNMYFVFSPAVTAITEFLSTEVKRVSPVSVSFTGSSFDASRTESTSTLHAPVRMLFSSRTYRAEGALVPFFTGTLGVQ